VDFLTGLLTIGPRFGGAIDDAARYFKDAYDRVRLDGHYWGMLFISWVVTTMMEWRF
jgi:citrate synthase